MCCCSALQCVAVCCSVLQCVAVWIEVDLMCVPSFLIHVCYVVGRGYRDATFLSLHSPVSHVP